MAKILLTGGAGFIGSHLAQRLLNCGHTLLLIDDLNDFYSPQVKLRNLEEVGESEACIFLRADICDSAHLERIFEQHRPEWIIHLAARAGVRPSLEQPFLYEQVNIRGTLNLLELARSFQIRRFIFASSSSVYGATSRIPFSEEEANPYPISPYGVTKLAGEKLSYCYSRLYGFPVVCLRFFTVYGPRQRPDLAIHKFASLMSQGEEISLFGDGSSLRDYTYIEDILDGIVASLELTSGFEIFNLGNSHPVSLVEMVRLLEDQLGTKARVHYLEEQPGDMRFTHADLTKAKRLLGYSPRVPFETGISQFVKWFKQTQRRS
jgi:UDP-glucuronate 4-epimerase